MSLIWTSWDVFTPKATQSWKSERRLWRRWGTRRRASKPFSLRLGQLQKWTHTEVEALKWLERLPAPWKGFQYLQSSGGHHWAGGENWAASQTTPQTQLRLFPAPPSALCFQAAPLELGCPHLPPPSAIASWLPQRLQGETPGCVFVRKWGVHFHDYFWLVLEKHRNSRHVELGEKISPRTHNKPWSKLVFEPICLKLRGEGKKNLPPPPSLVI